MSTSVHHHQPIKEHSEKLTSRYNKWLSHLTDLDKDPVRIFDPLEQKLLDELALIREVSRELQQKKEEDIKKAAQAAEVQEEEKAAEESTTEEKEAEDVEKSEEQEKVST